MGLRRLRRVWLAALCVLGFVFVAALAKRDLEHRALRSQVLRYLEPEAERGRGSFTACTRWQYWNRYGQLGVPGSPLGLSIYLLHRGYDDPPLIRSLLLCEARQGGAPTDLCSRLAQHALRDYPDDPKVQWAAGKLSNGDDQLTAERLGRCLALARKLSGGVSGFCHDAGLKEAKFRHELAAALTMLGRWDEADQVEPPDRGWMQRNFLPSDKPPDHDLSERAPEPVQYRQLVALRQLERSAVVSYLATLDAQNLAPLYRLLTSDQQQLSLIQKQEQAHPDDAPFTTKGLDDPSFLADEVGELELSILKAYFLSKNWTKVEQRLPDGKDDQTAEVAQLLISLIHGQQLGMTIQQEEATGFFETIKERMSDPDWSQAQSEGDWEDYGSTSTASAELAGLKGLLPYLVRSDLFQDALQRSGRPLPEVLAELRSVSQPGTASYYDNSNGPLRWK